MKVRVRQLYASFGRTHITLARRMVASMIPSMVTRLCRSTVFVLGFVSEWLCLSLHNNHGQVASVTYRRLRSRSWSRDRDRRGKMDRGRREEDRRTAAVTITKIADDRSPGYEKYTRRVARQLCGV